MAYGNLDPNGRDKKAGKLVKGNTGAGLSDLEQIFGHFDKSIQEIKNLSAVVSFIKDVKAKGAETLEKENIWRAQIIFLSSALDYYMHELTKYGLCEIFDEEWDMTLPYEQLAIDMGVLERALKEGKSIDWFSEYIADNYRLVTMGSYGAVERQLDLLGIPLENVAAKAFPREGTTIDPKVLKLEDTLRNMNMKRNNIVHKINKNFKGDTENISQEEVSGYINDVKHIVEAINKEAELMPMRKKERERKEKEAAKAANGSEGP